MKLVEYRDYSIKELADRHSRGQLDLTAPYQRAFSWTPAAQKEYLRYIIEKKLMLNPIIITEDGRNIEVFDGKQRISTILSFRRGEFPTDIGYYSNLSEDLQYDFDNIRIKASVLEFASYKEKEKEFQLINTKGKRLSSFDIFKSCAGTDQTVRHMVEKATSLVWPSSFRLKQSNIIELGCRFFLSHLGAGKSKGALFNSYSLVQDIDRPSISAEYINRLAARSNFLVTSMLWDSAAFPDKPLFHKKDILIFLTIHYIASMASQKTIDGNRDRISTTLRNMLVGWDNRTDKGHSQEGYLVKIIEQEFGWIVEDINKSPRLFSNEVKAQLIQESGATHSMYQVDHVIPYSRGGQSEVGNAQLLTPECNQSKGDR